MVSRGVEDLYRVQGSERGGREGGGQYGSGRFIEFR